MANSESNTLSCVTSPSIYDACYWESVFPCDDDGKPSSKRRRIDHEETAGDVKQNAPLYHDLENTFAPVIHSLEFLLEPFAFSLDNKDLDEEKVDSSPSWEDFFQYMVSQEPELVTVPDTVEDINVSPKPRQANRGRLESSVVVKGSKIRYSCSKCTTTFSTQIGVKNHMKTHKASKINYSSGHCMQPIQVYKKSFICPRCERGFSIKGDRLVHLVSESCIRADRYLRRVTGGWECTSCDKLFNSRDQAERHVRANHEAGRKLQCPVCKDDFTGFKGNALVRHVQDMHPEYLEELNC